MNTRGSLAPLAIRLPLPPLKLVAPLPLCEKSAFAIVATSSTLAPLATRALANFGFCNVLNAFASQLVLSTPLTPLPHEETSMP